MIYCSLDGRTTTYNDEKETENTSIVYTFYFYFEIFNSYQDTQFISSTVNMNDVWRYTRKPEKKSTVVSDYFIFRFVNGRRYFSQQPSIGGFSSYIHSTSTILYHKNKQEEDAKPI